MVELAHSKDLSSGSSHFADAHKRSIVSAADGYTSIVTHWDLKELKPHSKQQDVCSERDGLGICFMAAR